MTPPTPTRPGSLRPFDALDAEQAVVCRRHRRSTVVTGWARQQPALGTVPRLGDVNPLRTGKVTWQPKESRGRVRVVSGGAPGLGRNRRGES
jgi:hypothetical protein